MNCALKSMQNFERKIGSLPKPTAEQTRKREITRSCCVLTLDKMEAILWVNPVKKRSLFGHIEFGQFTQKNPAINNYISASCNGARSRNRTGTLFQARDFKSLASTNFAIRAF
jgi:hypothetical protein